MCLDFRMILVLCGSISRTLPYIGKFPLRLLFLDSVVGNLSSYFLQLFFCPFEFVFANKSVAIVRKGFFVCFVLTRGFIQLTVILRDNLVEFLYSFQPLFHGEVFILGCSVEQFQFGLFLHNGFRTVLANVSHGFFSL